MFTLKSKTMLFVAFLLLASLSCQALSFGSATEVPTVAPVNPTSVPASPTVPPADTETSPQQTEEPAATQPETTSPGTLPPLPPSQPGPEILDLGSLPEVHPLTDFSERFQVVTDFTDPDGAAQQMKSLYDFRQTSVPETAWYRLFEDDNLFLSQKDEIALVAGQGYELSSESSTCRVVIVEVVDNSGQRKPFVDLIQSLTGQAARSEAEVMVGDQATDVYPLDSSNLLPGSEVEIKITSSDDSGSSTSTTTLALNDADSTLESGRLFLARQGGYLLRLELEYSRVVGEEDSFIAEQGSIMTRTVVYEAIPATTVEPIQPPQGCTATTGGSDDSGGDDTGGTGTFTMSDLPRLYDETNTVQAGDTLIFQTSQDMQFVLDFYRDKLEAVGWDVTDEINLGTLASLELERGSQTLSISITQSGGNLMVTVVLE